MRFVRLMLGRLAELSGFGQPLASGAAITGVVLYQFTACPYCARVRRALRKMGARVELVDIDRDRAARQRLAREGGRIQVPCLRIDDPEGVCWLYESRDIIKYLQGRLTHEQ